MATKDNLKAGFTGESEANRKYASFSAKAAEEGFPHVAKLFKAASEAEAIHARRHLSVYGVPSTADNLTASVSGETEEFTEMYPKFIKESEGEGNTDATRSFTFAMKAEQVHAGLYEKALEAVKSGKDLPAQPERGRDSRVSGRPVPRPVLFRFLQFHQLQHGVLRDAEGGRAPLGTGTDHAPLLTAAPRYE